MRYWDSSALVPLLVSEPTTPRATELFAADPEIVTWWGTEVECVSAIARREREGTGHPPAVAQALRRLDRLRDEWQEIRPLDSLRDTTRRLLRVHALRAADALQLAAALVVADSGRTTFVSFDQRLAAAAQLEGLDVVDL